MSDQTRRGLFKYAAAAVAAITGKVMLPSTTEAQQTGIVWQKKAVHRAPSAPAPNTPAAEATPAAAASTAPKKPPMFNGIVTFGNFVFIAGIGAHFEGTIEEHTKHVIDEIETNLKLAGSSIDKVLKVNVYLSDLANYDRMNAVYTGRWGDVPPVRTTVAVSGVPGKSLVEIDCIASL
jgi:2-iminobutanoate/2-iminopropanoate deaminase